MMRQKGFTLIELVAVLVLVGILAAVALPRLPVGSDFEGSLQARNLLGLLRLAQLRTMNDPQALQKNIGNYSCGVLAITGNGVSLSADCESATLLSSDVLNAPGQFVWLGIRDLPVTASQSLPLVLSFGEPASDTKFLSEASRLGRPFVNGEQLNETLEISMGGTTVLIEPEGYVHAQP